MLCLRHAGRKLWQLPPPATSKPIAWERSRHDPLSSKLQDLQLQQHKLFCCLQTEGCAILSGNQAPAHHAIFAQCCEQMPLACKATLQERHQEIRTLFGLLLNAPHRAFSVAEISASEIFTTSPAATSLQLQSAGIPDCASIYMAACRGLGQWKTSHGLLPTLANAKRLKACEPFLVPKNSFDVSGSHR